MSLLHIVLRGWLGYTGRLWRWMLDGGFVFVDALIGRDGEVRMGLCLPGSLTVGEEKSEFSEVWLCG